MKRMFEIWEMWDWLIDNGIATEDELKLITKMNGYNIHVLNDVLYYRTGYHNREQWERDKKETILKELKLNTYFTTYRRAEIINAYETNRPFTLFELLDISREADDLISKGYTVDEIIRAVREWVKERLDEIKKENN